MRIIKLQTSCIFNAQFEIYEKVFSFIVNDEEFKTSKIVSDLTSPHISNEFIQMIQHLTNLLLRMEFNKDKVSFSIIQENFERNF